jgi:predicted HTH transcriptional regulator
MEFSMLTDEELALRLIATEDSYVERKTVGDYKRWIPALVAFANSAPIGFPCVLFIGARDDGTLEPNVGVESLQKSFSEKAADVFPPIPYSSRVFRRKDSECLAVIVQGSPNRPHYAGLPYIRVGTESKKASPDDVAQLTAERDPKAYEILKWKGNAVTVDVLHSPETAVRLGRLATSTSSNVKDCNEFWVTLEGGSASSTYTVALRRIELSFDHDLKRLKLEIYAY